MRIKLLICIFVLSICSLGSQAQNIHFGPELGYRTIPTLKVGDTQYYQPGYRLGFRLDYGIIKHLSVSTGLYFTNDFKSSSSERISTLNDESPQLAGILETFGVDLPEAVAGVNISENNTTTMKLMSFPLLIKGDFKGLSATVGFSIDKLMSATTNQTIERDVLLRDLLEGDALDIPGSELLIPFLPAPSDASIVDSKNELKSTNLSLTLGLGYKFNDFDLNLLYHKSSLDYRDPAIIPADPYSSVSFSISYLISYKKLRGFQDRSTGEML